MNFKEVSSVKAARRKYKHRDLFDKEVAFILSKNAKGYCAKRCRLITSDAVEAAVDSVSATETEGTRIELKYNMSLQIIDDYEWLLGPSHDVIAYHQHFYSVMKNRVAWSSVYTDVSCQDIATLYMNEMSKYNQCMLSRLWETHLTLGVSASLIDNLKSCAVRLFNLNDDRVVTIDKLAIVIQKIYWSEEDLLAGANRHSGSSAADPVSNNKQKLLCDGLLKDLLDFINASVLQGHSTSSDRGTDDWDPLSERKFDRRMYYKVAWVMHRLYELHKRTVSLLTSRGSSNSNTSAIEETMSSYRLPPLWLQLLSIDLLYKSGLPFALDFYLECTSSIGRVNRSSSTVPCDEVRTGPDALMAALSSPDERKLAVLLQRVAAEQWQEYDGRCAAAIKAQSRRSYTSLVADDSVMNQQLSHGDDSIEQEVAVDRAFVLKRKRMQTEVCFICMEDNCQHSPTVSLLCCGQPTHVSCMARWYSTKSTSNEQTCPNCRQILREPTLTDSGVISADVGLGIGRTRNYQQLAILQGGRSVTELGREHTQGTVQTIRPYCHLVFSSLTVTVGDLRSSVHMMDRRYGPGYFNQFRSGGQDFLAAAAASFPEAGHPFTIPRYRPDDLASLYEHQHMSRIRGPRIPLYGPNEDFLFERRNGL